MNDILYLEGASGISGDMTVAALLALGGSREKLDAALKSLRLEDFDYAVTVGRSYGIAGYDFNVILRSGHDRRHNHGGGSGHEHDHDHNHEHRNLAEVYAVIDRGDLTERARELAKKIFRIVADAEAAAHGVGVDEVHFHEVGAVDSIADIVGAAVLIDDLDIKECIVTGLTEGGGTVHCRHGELPVPVPAVLNIASTAGIPLRGSGVDGEMVTPTGIAVAAAIRTRDKLPRQYTVKKIGTGLGKRDLGRPNILRAMLISELSSPREICLIESNIDDSTGETLGLAMEKLLAAGALDVHFIPCFMKKNRPAYLLRVIADAARVGEMERIIFENTTTIGVRKLPAERSCMERKTVELDFPLGRFQAKRCSWDDITRCYPEYESVKRIAERNAVPFAEVWEMAAAAAAEDAHDPR